MIPSRSCRDFALWREIQESFSEDSSCDPSPNTVSDLQICWAFLVTIQKTDLMPIKKLFLSIFSNLNYKALTCESLSIKVSSTSVNCNVSGPFRRNEPVAGTCG
jgi:hypothetical protein